MANFECSVKDLMPQTQTQTQNVISADTINVEHAKTADEPVPAEIPQDVKLSVYQRLYTDKNIKMAIFITLVYLVLNSEQMYAFLSNSVPLLFADGLPGFLGKAVIGVILSLIIVMFTSFFSM